MMMTFILTEFRFTEPLLQVYCPSESSVCNGLACFPARGQLAGNGSSFSTFKPTTTIQFRKETLTYIIGTFPFISHLLALFNLISDGYKLYTSIAGSIKGAAEEFSFVSSWSG